MMFQSVVIPIILLSGLALSMVLVLVRILRGPHLLDRVLCLDALTLIFICIFGVWELIVGSQFFFDAVLLLTIVGFITSVAASKYIETGDLIE